MELKRGYKLTEVGVIPEDWDVKKIGEITNTTAGGTPSTLIRQYWGGEIKWMSSGELHQRYVYDVASRITEEGLKNSSSKLIPPKCVLIGLAGQGKTRGTVAINMVELCTNQSIAAIFPSSAFIPEYLYFYLDSRYTELRKMSAGDGGRGGLNLHIINSISIPLPPLQEQRAIATALSDVDELLASLEALIEKKRMILQATMQELLTGRRRLPGFSGEWASYLIGDIFTFLKTANNTRSELSDHGDVGYIHYGDIHTRWRNFLDCSKEELPFISADKVRNVPFLEEGDLIVADASEDYDGIGASVEVKNISGRRIVAGLHTLLLRGNKQIVVDGFKGYLLYLPNVKTSLIKIATGISVYGISKDKLMNIKIQLPKIEEQREIAAVLSDMEAEIDALEQQREKTLQIKRGMMQELLTGRTRLV